MITPKQQAHIHQWVASLDASKLAEARAQVMAGLQAKPFDAAPAEEALRLLDVRLSVPAPAPAPTQAELDARAAARAQYEAIKAKNPVAAAAWAESHPEAFDQ